MGIWIVATVLVIILLAILNLYHQGVVDDVRLLNTSGSRLIKSEQKVQELLGHFSGQRYFLIEGTVIATGTRTRRVIRKIY